MLSSRSAGLILRGIEVDFKFVSQISSPSSLALVPEHLWSPIFILYSPCLHKQPMTWPDRISVYHKLRSRPTETTDSMLLDVMVLSEVRQRPAARCLEDCVTYDYRRGRKTTLPPWMLEQLQKTFDLQELAKSENSGRIRGLFDRVRALERLTWDREGATEDFGSQRS